MLDTLKIFVDIQWTFVDVHENLHIPKMPKVSLYFFLSPPKNRVEGNVVCSNTLHIDNVWWLAP